jgi:uncharacterized protein
MLPLLDSAEVRVLGALIEKEATTPEYYPLSLNALVNACNQKSNREPIVDYDDETVLAAIEGLREKRLAFIVTGSGRVTKYSQRLSETLNLGRRELAVVCTLLLRGQQTLGEIKDRSERMFAFGDSAEAERLLQKLEELPEGPLVKRLSRQPGQKEARYAHLFSGEPAPQLSSEKPASMETPTRVSKLEQELQALRGDFEELKRRFNDLEAQLR